MSNDVDHNSCEIPEEEYDESEHIFTTFSEGSIVWAKMAGFPWWPAMIEMDPDSEYFFIMESSESMHPSHYHVVFFDDKVSRAWVRTSCIEPFIGKENLGSMLNKKFQKHEKGPSFKKEVEAAKQKALQALELTPKERIQQYSFSVRYKGKWGSTSTKSQKEEKKKKLKKPAKKKYCNVGKAPRVEVLNDTTVDDLLNNPDCSVLRKLEDALDSMDSDLLTEESDKWELDDDMDDDWGMSENKDLSIQLSPVVSKPVSISRGERMKNRNNKRKSISPAESSSDSSSSEDEDGEEAKTKSSVKRLKKGGKKNKKITPREEQQSKSNEDSSSDEEFEEAEEMKFDPTIFTMEIDSEEEKVTNTNLPEDLIQLQNGNIEKVIENIKVEDVVEVQNEMLNHMLNQAEEIICDALISNVRDEIGDPENNGSICTGEKRKGDLTNNSGNDLLISKEKESGIVESDEAKENIKKKKEPKKKSKKKKESKQEDVNTPDKVVGIIDHQVSRPVSEDEVSASNGKATKKDQKSGKKTFKAPETKDSFDVQKPLYEEKEVPQDNMNQAKASDTQKPSDEDKTHLKIWYLDQNKEFPMKISVENLPHDDDVSLDIDVNPLHKHDSQGGMDIHNEMIAVGIQDDDDDSDPFEMIEE
ncbi:hypothetical protein FSP39_023334 [Pinctada imbricata]|uniref:PWWP domain-containing protein n=1 Tax=Pinctada imbricata TaxID=66713 RepID=A0AA88YRK2_PINIB|nr:hypothetical protein FSP39_023334 [Pinctada imbricata]